MIALDARGTAVHGQRGIGRVIRELVDAIARLPQVARDDVIVVGDQQPNPALSNRPMVARTIGSILSPGNLLAYDVVLRLAPSAPELRPGAPRQLVCCYDLIQLKARREHFPLHRRIRYPSRWMSFQRSLETIKRADSVWTISRAVADDVHALLGVGRDRLVPVPLAASSTLAVPDAATCAGILQRLRLTEPYLLWLLGGPNENKNVRGMMRVMATGNVPSLVIVGVTAAWAQEKIGWLARSVGAPPPRFLGFIPDAELGAVLHGAHAVVVPSKDEGFGLPIVEAFKCGARVVANDIPVLREVGGEAAVFADINHPQAFAAALRNHAVARPLPPIRTWDDVAQDVLRLARRLRDDVAG